MSSIKNVITNYKTDKLDSIVYDDRLKGNYLSVDVYNNNINIPLTKIILLSPYLRIFRNSLRITDNMQYTIPLNVIVGENTNKIKSFRLFIKKLERQITDHIFSKIKKRKVKYSIKKLNKELAETMTINLPFTKKNNCYEFSFNIYDQNNSRVGIDQLNYGLTARSCIELDNVWIRDDKIGFNWVVKQMKICPNIDFTKCLFDEDEMTEIGKPTECYHCLYCPNYARTHYCVNNNCDMNNNYQIINSNTSSLPPPPPPPPKITKQSTSTFVPTVADLKSVKLKPIPPPEIVTTDSEEDIIEEINKTKSTLK
jgi:hypothetical protein